MTSTNLSGYGGLTRTKAEGAGCLHTHQPDRGKWARHARNVILLVRAGGASSPY